MKFRLTLLGTIVLTAPDGSDATPRMAKTQGLLAILAVARGRSVHRASLQDLLWSDRGQKQGRDSLRNALSELRRCLSAVDPNPLETDGGPVSLCLEAVEVDLFAPDAETSEQLYQPEFLAGLDIADEEFNRWLSQMRAKLEGRPRPVSLPEQSRPYVVGENVSTHREARPLFEVGILPVEGSEEDRKSKAFGDLLLSALITLFDQSSVIVPYDFRQQAIGGGRPDVRPDVLLGLQLSRLGSATVATCRARHVASGRVIWSWTDSVEPADLSPAWLTSWSASAFDHLSERLRTYGGFEDTDHEVSRMVLSAVDKIFHLSPNELEEAGNLLDVACERVEASTIFGWNAFLTAFLAEKEGRKRNLGMLERAEWLANRAMELDRFNPLTSALVAHIYSFVLRDLDRAAEIIAPVRDHSSRSPYLADTIAMLHFYTGDYEQARTYARQATTIGRFSPFRYSFTTSLAMSELMLGEFDSSVRHCKAALAQHRVRGGYLYEPTLRTIAAASGHLGLRDEGRSALTVLGKQGGYEPIARLKAGDTPYPNRDVLTVVRQGMEKLYA